MLTQGWLTDQRCGYKFDVSRLYYNEHNVNNFMVSDSDYISVMIGYCSDLMDYCRKVSLLEGSKNRDSLLKKLVCGWWVVGMCVCVHECFLTRRVVGNVSIAP